MDESERLAVAAPQLVREVHALGHLAHDVEPQGVVDALAAADPVAAAEPLEQRREIAAVDVLEHDEVLALGGDAEVVDLHDVLVRQRGVDARLDLQHLHEAHVLGQPGQHALDDHQLLEALLATRAAEVELGHRADREALEQLVMAEPAAGQERHGCAGGWR